MHLAPAPTAARPHHHGQHVPGHRTGRPGHIHPAQQVQGTRHPPPRCRIPRLGPPPPKHQHQHIPGDKRTQAPDGGKKADQRALAHITVHPAAHLPKDFGTERHIILEGQAHHIITTALYTLAAHECHSDPTTIPAMPPPPQGPPRSRHPLPHRSTPKPHGHPTPPPLQERTSHRIVGHPGHPPPNNPPSTSSKRTPNGGSSTGHTESSWWPRPIPQK